MSKLVSDLLIFPSLRTMDRRIYLFPDQNYRFVYIPVSDQLETGNSASGSGSVYADLFL